MGWTAEELGFDSRQVKEIFSYPKHRNRLGAQRTSTAMGTGGYFHWGEVARA
jgi:hypothetical protein